jgi:molecular chaperone DnaK (HSP70)
MADEGEFAPRARICIDFGTAVSKACLCLDPSMPLDSGVRPLPIGAVSGAEHPLLSPSVLYVDGGRMFFGAAALSRARNGVESNRDPLLSFKTILGAENAEQALSERMPATMDPTATFRQRDAVVLYLAYLDQLIGEAIARLPDAPLSAAHARRRYTSPVWRPGTSQDRVFETIFNEAAAASHRLGRLLLAGEGVSIAHCRDVLEKARANPGNGRLETGVFEPHAAAAASLAYTNEPARVVMVIDMGAGTTDIAAFEFDERTNPPALSEIKSARQCSALAGDEIDRLLIGAFVRKRGFSGPDDQARFLRNARLTARPLKHEFFAEGHATLRDGRRSISLRAQELSDDPNFKKFMAALGNSIAYSIAAVAERSRFNRARVVDIVLAGGGSNLPFLPQLTHMAAQHVAPHLAVRIGPLSPANPLYDRVDYYFADVFAQIAISIGGSLVEMLPAQA